MATLTIAQALVSAASGLTVVDSAVNIANAVSNASLVSRVILFKLNAASTSTAAQAALLATLGSKFSKAGFAYTVKDSVAALSDTANADGLALATGINVYDTAANLLAAAATPLMQHATAVTMSAGATLTVAAVQILLALPGFTVQNGVSATLLDTAANLAAMSSAQQKGWMKFYTVSVSGTVSEATAAHLITLHNFSVSASAVLTVSDTVAVMTSGSITSVLTSLAALARVTLTVADTWANLTAASSALATLAVQYPALTTVMTNSLTVSAADLQATANAVANLPHFSVAAGQSFILADTVENLMALSAGSASLVQQTHLLANATVTVAELLHLESLPHFTAGNGNILSVTDNAANVAGLTTQQRIGIANFSVVDTIANIVAVNSVPLATTAIFAQVDSATYTAAQAAILQGLTTHGATLTLVEGDGGSSLVIVDTIHDVVSVSAALTALMLQVTILVSPSDTNAILSGADAAALVAADLFPLGPYTISVADTGPAITAVASQIFDVGFTTISVISGVFSGTIDELLDPTLHFGSPSNGLVFAQTMGTVTPSAHLSVSAVASVAQAVALAILPGFSVDTGVTLTIQDTMADLVAGAGAVESVATDVQVTDSETLTAAAATQLAGIKTTLGNAHFDLAGHQLTVADIPANLAAQANAAGLALASSVVLSANSVATAAEAAQLVALGTLFSTAGFTLIIDDSVSNLAALAAVPATLSAVNALATDVLLSADATVDVASLQSLLPLSGFSAGSHHLTLQDTPTAILTAYAGGVPFATAVVLAPHDSAWIESALDATRLAALPHFSGGAAGMAVSDTAINILAAHNAAGIAAAMSVTLSTDASVSVQAAETLFALTGFSTGGHNITIIDNAANLASLDNTTAGHASAILLQGPGLVSVAQFIALDELTGFSTNSYALTVSDTAVNLLTLSPSQALLANAIVLSAPAQVTADQAQALSLLPNLHVAGGMLTIADTVENLLLGADESTPPTDLAGELLASTDMLTADATVTAAQAVILAQLGLRFSNGGHVLTVEDTPTALLAVGDSLGPIGRQISATVLSDNDFPWVVSISEARQLSTLPNFSVGSAGGVVADLVGNLLAPGNAAFLTNAPMITLNSDATVSVSQAEALHAHSNFSLGSNQLTITDGAGHLATLDGPTAAMAIAILLQGSSIISAAQFEAVSALPNYSNNGKLLVVSDTAANLIALAGDSLSLASEIVLSSDATLTADQAEVLATLPNFTNGIAHLAIQDTAENLLHVSGGGSTPDDWAGELTATSVTLTADATVTTPQANELAMLGSRFSAGGFMLTISDNPANLSGDETVSAATATSFAAVNGFSKNGHVLAISDTAEDLLFSGYATGRALADVVELSTAVSLSVHDAKLLAAQPNFQSNPDALVTITDTFGNLLKLATASSTALQGMAIALSDDATVTVAQLHALAALTQYNLSGNSFSLNGFALTIDDTARHIVSYTPDGVTTPTSYMLSGDGTVTAIQADLLATLQVSLDDNSLTVADTPAALLDAGNASGLALATNVTLSGDAIVTAAEAAALAAMSTFTTGGHRMVVQDSALALLGLSDDVSTMATGLALASSDVVDVATLIGLTHLGSRFSLGGNTLTVSDTAAHLSMLNSLETDLTTSQVLTEDTATTAAGAVVLTSLPNLLLNGHELSISDTAAALLDPAYASVLAQASHLTLTAPAYLNAHDAAALLGLEKFQATDDAPVNVADTLANLLALGTQGMAQVATALQTTPIGLSADAVATVAQLAALAELPQCALPGNEFSLNGHTLILADTGQHLAAYTPDSIVSPTAYVMIGDATVTAAQANALSR